MMLTTPETRLTALGIAASVFSQIDKTQTILPNEGRPPGEWLVGDRFEQHRPRTLEDFRLSVDAVFKAAGLDKVEWGSEPLV